MSKELEANNPGAVMLRGQLVPIDSAVGGAFVTDLCKEDEGIMPADDLKLKWELSDEQAVSLATNEPLIKAVRAEKERRVFSGTAAQDAAAFHFSKAPHRLGHMVQDNMESSRNRIEATKELGKIAGGARPETMPRDKVTINIILGPREDQKFTIEARPPLSLPLKTTRDRCGGLQCMEGWESNKDNGPLVVRPTGH